VAAGPNVSNTSGTGETMYGDWSTPTGYGYVFLGEESGQGGFGDVYQEEGTWVECSPSDEPVANTKDTGPGEGEYGFVGTRTWGYAYDVQIDLPRRLETGHATGTVDLFTETVDECNGVYGGDAVEYSDVPMQATLSEWSAARAPACAECHQGEFQLWHGSHHDRAMESRNNHGDAWAAYAGEKPHAQLRSSHARAGIAGRDDHIRLALAGELAG
jgi:hypothetical protein